MDPLEHAIGLRRSGAPHVLVSVVSTRGSAPQDAGAKMTIPADASPSGTVGGGRIEAAVILRAREILAGRRPPELVTWNLQRDIGMTCGGEMQFFFDPFAGAAWTIAVFGAGHTAQALIPVLAPLECRLHCFDDRPGWLDKVGPFPNLRTAPAGEPAAALATLPPDAFVLLLTQGHSTDFPFLREALAAHDFPFVGVIGSASKRAALERDLREAGIPKDRIALFHCPLGLPIGTNHPHEIAISIAAGLVQARDRIREARSSQPNS